MAARGIPMGFGFWNEVAGFDINLHLIPYSATSSYGQAFWVGLLNTLLVAAIGIPLATLLGFAVGVARLSPNWLLSRSALLYITILRNTPLLLQLLFWYNAVLKTLPGPRQSLSLGGWIFLNNRGLFLPAAGSAHRRAGICRLRSSQPSSRRWFFGCGRGAARI